MIYVGIILGVIIGVLVAVAFAIGWLMGESATFDKIVSTLSMSSSDAYQLGKKIGINR